jgi:hypothetical protein
MLDKLKKFFTKKSNRIKQYVTRSNDKLCQCTFCKEYEFEKWATIMECSCGCHTGDGMVGHDVLCCALPNGLRKNNPHKNLEKAEVYKKRINDYLGDEI